MIAVPEPGFFSARYPIHELQFRLRRRTFTQKRRVLVVNMPFVHIDGAPD
jgi:hypothetical protein